VPDNEKQPRNLCGPIIRLLRQELRGERGRRLSVEELADRIEAQGVSMSFGHLAKIERQVKEVNDYQLQAIAAALGVSILELYPSKEE
jgi:transcriptional regulator with XRE-family HTH domain